MILMTPNIEPTLFKFRTPYLTQSEIAFFFLFYSKATLSED
ncbi:hypothetical protein BH10BAC3_BH10BAC3_26360 [soil metagenome]